MSPAPAEPGLASGIASAGHAVQAGAAVAATPTTRIACAVPAAAKAAVVTVKPVELPVPTTRRC